MCMLSEFQTLRKCLASKNLITAGAQAVSGPCCPSMHMEHLYIVFSSGAVDKVREEGEGAAKLDLGRGGKFSSEVTTE